jgi:phage internal scaffolding protein
MTNKQTNKQTNITETNTPTRKPYFRHAYTPQHRLLKHFDGPGRTKQEFKDESDINNIMARYMRTGLIDNVTQKLPQFADVDGSTFHDAMMIVAESKTLFQELPSHIRTEFDNDPGQFLDFVHNPENRSQMAEWGLLAPDADLGTPTINAPQSIQSTPQSANPQGENPKGENPKTS